MSKIGNHLLVAVLTSCGLAQSAYAQSTDGFHSIQIFPVVVDSSTFTQRFYFANANDQDMTVQVSFYPGDGTAQANTGPVSCLPVTIPQRSRTRQK